MFYLEMSRDETHGGGSWKFPNCLWAPAEKRNGGKWPFWNKVLDVKEGDAILHLRGKRPNAHFVGYSIASGNGFETSQRPPTPKEWGYAKSFFRANLKDFTPFPYPVDLDYLFSQKRADFETYFDKNRSISDKKLNIFYVRQSNRLQCLNGAYLSDVDKNLCSLLFGIEIHGDFSAPNDRLSTIKTGEAISSATRRIGQAKFSNEVKSIYGTKCCFPDCTVSDNRFLIGSHIARWADNNQLRGHLGNGLCLCLHHDKAFELGAFTLDTQCRVFVNPEERTSSSTVIQELIPYHGHSIRKARVEPLKHALEEHWKRIGINEKELR